MGNTAEITKIFDNVWQFHEQSDAAIVDAYLVVGSERAVLIDCLQTVCGLYDEVRKITSLPFDVLITHGHLDHLGDDAVNLKAAGCRIYMDSRDLMIPEKLHGTHFEDGFFTSLAPGDIFDLRGVKLEVLDMPGHTPGSVVYFDRENQRLYSGDAIGSGSIWLQIPCTSRLSEFCANIKKLYEKLASYSGLLILPGHRYQSPVPIGLQYIRDVISCTEKVIAGELTGESDVLHFPSGDINCRSASYGQMLSFCYDPERL